MVVVARRAPLPLRYVIHCGSFLFAFLCGWSRLLATQTMFPIEWFRQFLYWCALPFLVLLGLILLRRRFYRELPLFFSYVVFAAISGFIRLIAYIVSRPSYFVSTHPHPHAYSYTFWISSFIGSVFSILAVYEIFVKRLFAGYYKVRFFRHLFPAVAVTTV